ncbi:MAG TPA: FecR domain-containing protein [Candidatus Baltobacteraceae bacterium]|nr:FecR domain-containing protein [Candidatus Baltobacteraceae bacterium]
MKFAQAFLCAVVCGFIFSLSSASAQTTKAGYATIVRIEGEARYSNGNNEWHPLTVGQTLSAGCIIQSADNSIVDLVLGDKIPHQINPHPDKVAPAADPNVRGMASYKATAQQNVIRMKPNTVLAIDKLTIANTGVDAVSDTELDLRQGTIFGNVKKLSASSQYLIKIPNGIAGVRGTTFTISATGAITDIAGSMVISHTDSNGQTTTVVLGPGDQYDPATGQVTHLSGKDFGQAVHTAVVVITVVEGIISFADDRTVIYISPTHGRFP